MLQLFCSSTTNLFWVGEAPPLHAPLLGLRPRPDLVVPQGLVFSPTLSNLYMHFIRMTHTILRKLHHYLLTTPKTQDRCHTLTRINLHTGTVAPHKRTQGLTHKIYTNTHHSLFPRIHNTTHCHTEQHPFPTQTSPPHLELHNTQTISTQKLRSLTSKSYRPHKTLHYALHQAAQTPHPYYIFTVTH